MALETDLNYFVCTLGESMTTGLGDHFQNINELISQRAKRAPNHPAIGFYRVSQRHGEHALEPQVLTFGEIMQGILLTARILSERITIVAGDTVGLLSSSSPEFLFTWLAFIWLGNPVLIIAPECSPLGIASLCQNCGVTKLLVDEKNEERALQATQEVTGEKQSTFTCYRIPFDEDEIFENAESTTQVDLRCTNPKGTDVAYYHHTSGTSSGIPKPIPQSHSGTVGALPILQGQRSATFTTTPLYHGGPADIFRSWSSCAMIWLFPSQHIPITSSNVIRCLDQANEYAKTTEAARVKYFASVPYILQLMATDPSGLRCLQNMDLVGVGGAALPQQVGDELVNNGVRLVSRYGSAECGFLLSSHRDYEHDKDWQYLRLPKFSGCHSLLVFEDRDDGLAELVVQPHWPHMAKRNREDGSYATSDLFIRHPEKKDVWKYHSRADAQLTLITGKKFDPSPIESKLVAAASSLLSDVLVFGNGKAYPGLLVFRAANAMNMSDQDLLDKVIPLIEQMNSENLTHARIPDSMVFPLPYSESPLEKSSKGSILRGKSEERYAQWIENAYKISPDNNLTECADEHLPRTINKLIRNVLPKNASLENNTDLFSLGVDSVAGMQIRSRLAQFLPKDKSPLPVNVVESCGTVDNLVKYILALRHGDSVNNNREGFDSGDLMRHLVEKYGSFAERRCRRVDVEETLTNEIKETPEDTIILTGATGVLGAHVLDQLANHPTVTKIYCLVRGADSQAAYQRVAKALKYRQLQALDARTNVKIDILRAKISHPSLGLENEVYQRIAKEGTIIMHLAWSVNFRITLRSFEKDHIAGLRNLLDLALSSTRPSSPHFVFCSSVASVANHSDAIVPEEILENPASAPRSGYSQSKWVAEQICNRASQQTRLQGRISILRVGQLSGDTRTGIWNTKEAWPLMLSTVKLTETLPDLTGEVLDWLPVDVGASAVIESVSKLKGSHNHHLQVYHILNSNKCPDWETFLAWLQNKVNFKIVSPDQWIADVENLAQKKPDHPSIQLLDHWRNALLRQRNEDSSPIQKEFSMVRTKQDLPVLQDVQPLSENYLSKLWSWIDREM